MAQFTIYRNTDSGAPIMSGGSGTLTGLLTSCLVNGYGSKNGAGWTLSFSGASQAVYRQGSGNQFYLWVDDSGPGAGTTKEARICGYETINNIASGSGTNPFPTASQGVGSKPMVIARKSTTADTAQRNWIVAADNRTSYVFISTADTANTYYGFAFGDIYSSVSGDSYRTMIIGRDVENTGLATTENIDKLSTISGTVNGSFVARAYNGAGTSLAVGKHGDGYKGSTSALIGTLTYPNPQNNATYISPVWIQEVGGPLIRGRMRGFYHFLHSLANVNDGDTFDGKGTPYTGKSFLIIKQGGNSSVFVIETTDTLDTN